METSSNAASVRIAADEYARIRVQRDALEAQLKELKAREDEAKATLIAAMSADNMPSVRFEGLGRFVIKQNHRYDIQDIDLVCRAMLARMVDNGRNGRPLSDGLILQKRTAKTVLDEIIETESTDAAALAGMGLAEVVTTDLTFTRQKA